MSSDEEEYPNYTPFDANAIKQAKKSWKKVKALVPNWHEIFFELLFEKAPGGRSLFPFDLTTVVGNRDLADHASRVQNALETALNGLRDYNELVPVLESLGERHFEYGVIPEHIDFFEEVFIDTLRAGLKRKFTAKLQACWTVVFRLILDPLRHSLVKAQTKAREEQSGDILRRLRNRADFVSRTRAEQLAKKRQAKPMPAPVAGDESEAAYQGESDYDSDVRSSMSSLTHMRISTASNRPPHNISPAADRKDSQASSMMTSPELGRKYSQISRSSMVSTSVQSPPVVRKYSQVSSASTAASPKLARSSRASVVSTLL
eukprot:TRINITY_DN27360_c0_g1_i1.p1 TRINITY_DN27360_c0_g1~~TRINITY_DN27360_c0_g1_i1.p1  ORF type:complete len:318 (+),score=65.03 TRINITY_DN27360_c0_g1_i1:165-1118(+)